METLEKQTVDLRIKRREPLEIGADGSAQLLVQVRPVDGAGKLAIGHEEYLALYGDAAREAALTLSGVMRFTLADGRVVGTPEPVGERMTLSTLREMLRGEDGAGAGELLMSVAIAESEGVTSFRYPPRMRTETYTDRGRTVEYSEPPFTSIIVAIESEPRERPLSSVIEDLRESLRADEEYVAGLVAGDSITEEDRRYYSGRAEEMVGLMTRAERLREAGMTTVRANCIDIADALTLAEERMQRERSIALER